MNLNSWDDGEGGYYFNDISNPRILEARSKTSTGTNDTPSFDTSHKKPIPSSMVESNV
jgi:hypothetical protein